MEEYGIEVWLEIYKNTYFELWLIHILAYFSQDSKDNNKEIAC